MTVFSFKKEERLNSKILIDKLFSEGKVIFCYPFKLIYIFTDFESDYPAQLLISVPKKKFKKAVDRNLLKRKIREIYRLNKEGFYSNLKLKKKKILLAFIYTANEIYDYNTIESKLLKAISIIKI